MSSPIKFGTDGWRGIIAQDFTFDNVRVCAQSVANYVSNAGLSGRGLVIGYDTRFASEDFAAATAEVIAANGIKVYLCQQAAPTPVIGYTILNEKAGGGIIITASHNPAAWNGIKFKTEHATSASSQVTAELERHIATIDEAKDVPRLPIEEATRKGMVHPLNPYPAYLEHIESLVDIERLRGAGLKVVVDSMYGAGAGYFRDILGRGATKVIELHGERNPLFPGIQPEPIARNLAALCTRVRRTRASVGLATDGDADRIGVVDERGVFVTPLQVFALLALYLIEVCGTRGAIVKSITSTSMLYRLGELYGVPVFETPVGFKYIAAKMMEEDAIIGGEESGGFGFRDNILERDGILSGLYFLDLMTRLGKTPTELLDYLYGKIGPHFYERLDIHFPQEQREAIIHRLNIFRPSHLGDTAVDEVDTEDGFRYLLSDRSWLLVRFSGTEPILRIYAESDSIERVRRLLEEGRKMVGV